MMSATPEKVLLSPVGGQAIHGIVKYFKEKGLEVIGIDRNPEAIGRHLVDKFFVVPDINDQAYMGSVLKVIAENKVDLFISWLDTEIIFWNNRFYASEIPNELINIFTFNFREDLTNFCDKFMFYSLLCGNGFDCPEMSLLEDTVNAKNVDFPAIIKPKMGQGSKNTHIVENEETFEYFRGVLSSKFGNTEEFIVQKFLDGIEYTIDFFSENGVIKNLVIRQRTEHRGVSLRGEIVHDSKIEALINRFCSAFNINGLNNVQIITSDNDLYVVEYNPRPSGTIALSINAGVDLLNNVIEQRYHKKVTQYGQPKRLKMIRYLSELYYE